MEKNKGNSTFVCLENITKTFGKIDALRSVNMDILENKITAVVGDNGSGKSTLIKILSGTYRPDSGNINIRDKNYKFLTPKQAHVNGIATVFQDLSLDNYRDVMENIFLGQEITKFGFVLDNKRMYSLTAKLLESLNINIPYLKTPVGYLSGGQRQSVAIARAIFQGRNLIIFDEPTAAMGVKESKAVNQLIRSLPEKGFTVLIISHDIYQVFNVADKIYVMQQGKIVESVMKTQTTPQKLIERVSSCG